MNSLKERGDTEQGVPAAFLVVFPCAAACTRPYALPRRSRTRDGPEIVQSPAPPPSLPGIPYLTGVLACATQADPWERVFAAQSAFLFGR